MEQFHLTQAIQDFMHPTPYTGVKPLLLIAEELVTATNVGHVSEAVWVGINSSDDFTYISKFAVSANIILQKYYQASEIEPFKGRIALTTEENLKNTILHRNTVAKIKELEIKRFKLLDEIKKDFDLLESLYLDKKEIYLFEKKNGQWDEELFSDFNINTPYKLFSIQKKSTILYLYLKKSKISKIKRYLNTDKFYGYFIGSQAEIAGLKLKDESYLAGIASLENEAKAIIKKIQWLDLDDPKLLKITQKLPKHPFEEYFKYVKKENIRKLTVDDSLVDALKSIILKHIPENDTPLGMEYIPIDKLLYLFHMIIPREDALLALERCDIVYEPPGMLLGYNGKHQIPPKYLVPIRHVAYAYQEFENFISVCKNT